MELKELQQSITKLVSELLNVNVELLKYEEDLLSHGLDSLNSIRLLVKLEEAFDIEFDDDDLLYENFSSIENILETSLKYF